MLIMAGDGRGFPLDYDDWSVERVSVMREPAQRLREETGTLLRARVWWQRAPPAREKFWAPGPRDTE